MSPNQPKKQVSTTVILDFMKENVKNKEMIDAHTWVDAAQKLNVLIGDEHDKLFDLQQKVNMEKVALIEAGKNVSTAKLMIEAGDIYKEMCKQRALIEQVEEMIRIAKLQARIKDNEFRNY